MKPIALVIIDGALTLSPPVMWLTVGRMSRESRPQATFGSFPTEGFLGTGAPSTADLNLMMQAAMGASFLAGTLLARRKRYRAHAIGQSLVLALGTLAELLGMYMAVVAGTQLLSERLCFNHWKVWMRVEWAL